ncbi:hypothetical protein FDUTEX481_05726 [Tolypothrix sp. PCC 7601]|nr:hypothetical protein FDUTEX481_05726 [Tolypothrix sp. PCC 7601]
MYHTEPESIQLIQKVVDTGIFSLPDAINIFNLIEDKFSSE